jgi:hypothetical protein
MELQKRVFERGRKRPIRLSMYGASLDEHGLNVPVDWRYDAYSDFLKLSPSYRMVHLYHLGRAALEDLPPDRERLIQIYQDFGDYKALCSDDWWFTRGMKLFGIKAPTADVVVVGELNQQTTSLNASRVGHDALVLTVPLSLTRVDALKKLKKVLAGYEFSSPPAEDVAPKYMLHKSKLQKRKIYDAHDAFRMYLQGKPLWQIGIDLNLVPNKCFDYKHLTAEELKDYSTFKNPLAAAASREVRKAFFISENAARGIFPSDKSITDYFKKAWKININPNTDYETGNKTASKRKLGRPSKKEMDNVPK